MNHGWWKLAEENAKIEEKSSSTSGAKNPLLIVIVIVNTIAVLGIGFLQFQNHKKLNSVMTASDILQQQLAGEQGGAGSEVKADGGGGQVAGTEGAGGAGASDGKTGKTDSKVDGLFYPLDPFTANLAQGDGPKRYIRISMVLKFNKETKKEEIDARKPQISDVIISMLNAKRSEDLLKKEGKEYLKEEIKTSINNFLVDGKLEDIFYVGFQIN